MEKMAPILSYVLLSLLGLSQLCCSQVEDCQYRFVQQPGPSSLLPCNPWPLVQSQNSTLSLHCDILGPQSMYTPNIMWFRRRDNGTQDRIYIDRHKYFGPVSSGDISQELKRVNFTLRIVNVSSTDDGGCYWCMVEVSADGSDCTSPLMRSSSFCLEDEDSYSNLSSCTVLPTNTTETCAGSKSCIVPTSAHRQSTQTLRTNVKEVLPTNTTETCAGTKSCVRPTSANQQSTQAAGEPAHSTMISPPFTDAVVPNTQPNDDTVAINTNTDVRQFDGDAVVPTITGVPQSGGDAAVRAALYVGVVVCFILLVVIVILVIAVVLLWRKKVPCQPTSTRRPMTPNIPSHQRPVGAPSRPVAVGVDHSSNITHHRLPVRLGPPPSPGNEEDSVSLSSQASSDVHYYHVLERPKYYNLTYLEELQLPLIAMDTSGSSDFEDVGELSRAFGKKQDVSGRARGTVAPEFGSAFSARQWGRGYRGDAYATAGKRNRHTRHHPYKGLERSTLDPVSGYTRLVVPSQ